MGLQFKPSKRRVDYENQTDDVALTGDLNVSGNLVVAGTLTTSGLVVPAVTGSAGTFTVGADLIVTTTTAMAGNCTITAAATPTLATTDTTNTVTNVFRSNDTVGQVGTTTAHPLEIIANGTARIAVASAGTINVTGATTFTSVNVTLSGATTPTLTITDTTNTVSLVAKSDDTDGTVGTSTAHSLKLITNGTLALTITTAQLATFAGAVTITGAAIASSTLAVTGAVTMASTLVVSGTALTLTNAASPVITVTDTTSTVSTVMSSDNTTGILGTSTNHPLLIKTNATTAITISEAGVTTLAFATTITGALTQTGLATFAGGVTLSGAANQVLTITDTTTPSTFRVTLADTTATLGTTTNHSLILNTNNTTALTITGAQAATFAGAVTITGAAIASSTLSVVGVFTHLGETITASAVTATADGLTTGLITQAMGYVNVTSANAAHIVTLPAAVVGIRIELWVNTTGCLIRTPAASNVKINNVDADGGAASLTVAVGERVKLFCVATTEWKAERWTIAGAATTAVPA